MDLIEKLEQATGPDRALDAAITVVLDIREEWLRSDDRPLVASADDKGCPTARLGHVSAGKFGPGFEAPRYTASIDAALTLVPEGSTWDLTFDDYLIACVGSGHNTGKHDTAPAIALCIAALKSRA